MVIDKKLNLDRALEYFPDGSLIFAQNTVISNDGLAIQNEPAIVNFVTKSNFNLAGFIACNEEFVLFGTEVNDSNIEVSAIYRINKDKSKEPIKCNNNWQWEGGEVFGTYTYNVNNELIVAVSERVLNEDNVPLKVINLDRDKIIDGIDDNIYTLTPDIPKSNIVGFEYITGSRIKKGVYNFFIKYFINDDYETAWFPIGTPIFAYDNLSSDTAKVIESERIQAIGELSDEGLPEKDQIYNINYNDFYNEDTEYTTNNIKLSLEINDSLQYTHYKIGYIINTSTGNEGRQSPKYVINYKNVLINDSSEPVSIDDLTVGNFNIYNVNTLCNYKNRLYLANYKEENRNSIVDKIDTSQIRVYYDANGSDFNNRVDQNDFSALRNQYKSKPGRGAVYNFFIHYVYPNGNYTDGIPIKNVSNYEEVVTYGSWTFVLGRIPNSLEYNCNAETLTDDIYNAIQQAKVTYGDTSVYELEIDTDLETFLASNPGVTWFSVRANWGNSNSRAATTTPSRLVELANYINSNNDILYMTPMYEEFNVNKLYFRGIKMYPEFIGYFISYENPEYIQIAEGLVVNDTTEVVLDDISTKVNYDLFTQNSNNSHDTFKFYYPEFNIIGGKTDISRIAVTGVHARIIDNNWVFKREDNYANFQTATGKVLGQVNYYAGTAQAVEKTEIITPNSFNNIGKEGHLKFKLSESTLLNPSNSIYNVTAYTDNLNIYLSKNKKLISLGYIKYVNYESEDSLYGYGDEDVPYNYDFYKCFSSILFFHRDGIIINQTDSNHSKASDGSDHYPYSVKGIIITDEYDIDLVEPHIGIIQYWHETHYPLFLKEINQPGDVIFHSYYSLSYNWQGEGFNNIENKQVQQKNIIISPQYVNDLYKLDPIYYDYTGKLIVNYDDSLISNQMEFYGKTVRRSDVIQSESIINSWRYFRPENYKIITENKGNITNVVGIGNYLFVHCEHSLFMFDISDSLQTIDKNVQLLQPDSFEVSYKEVFTADKGFGGLQDFESWICDEFGYIFYDKSSAKIYRFDGGQLKDMTEGVETLIKSFKPEHIWIGNDRLRNRIMMNFRGADDSLIMSYNLISNGWTSTHSYTSNVKFIGIKDELYLVNVEGDKVYIDNYNKDKFNSYRPPVGNIANDDTAKSFVDVIFTNVYNKIKVLDFITYILNKEPNDNFEILQLEIYTNCCYSGVIDIREERKKISEYKKPYYDYERWNFNWFRNRIDKIENGDLIDRLSGRIISYPEKVQRGYDNALISGKYVVIRFQFKNTTKEVSVKDIQAYFKP